MEKGAVVSRTVENPKTKRDITIYVVKMMSNIGTFNIQDEITTSYSSSVVEGAPVGAHFHETTPKKDKSGTIGHSDTQTSTILEVETLKMGARAPGGAQEGPKEVSP